MSQPNCLFSLRLHISREQVQQEIQNTGAVLEQHKLGTEKSIGSALEAPPFPSQVWTK